MSLNQESIAKIFRLLYTAETETGETRSLSEYQNLFPGYSEQIEELYQRINLGDSDMVVADAPPLRVVPISGPGDRVGHYRIQRELGRGGQAIVFLAEDEKLNRNVALKILTRSSLASASTLERFRREAEACSKLNHPNICTVYESGVIADLPFIAMEYVDGSPISQHIEQSRRGSVESDEVFFQSETVESAASAHVSPDEINSLVSMPAKTEIAGLVKAFADAARALNAAHEAGIIHRDIKPGNLMLREDGSPVMLDFGLAQDLESDRHSITQTGDFFGTPAYMSPEQISAHRIRLDHRTDIFSLAVSLYESLTLERPFDSATREGIYQAILTKNPKDARKINPAIPKDLTVVIGKAMEKDRDRRYATALEFGEDLDRVRRIEPIKAKAAGPLLRLQRWTQRNKAIAALLFLIPVCAVIGSLVTWDLRSRRESQELASEIRKHWKDLEVDFHELQSTFDQQSIAVLLQTRVTNRIKSHIDAIGKDSRDWIMAKLKSDVENEVLGAVLTISELGDLDAAKDLADMIISDECNQKVQVTCSRALMLMPDPVVVPHLWRVYRHPEAYAGVKVNTLFGLAAFKADGAFEECVNFYRNSSGESRFMAIILAQNVLLFSNETLMELARLYQADLGPKQFQHWDILVGYYTRIADAEACRRLAAIAANEKPGDAINKMARKGLRTIEEQAGAGDSDSLARKE